MNKVTVSAKTVEEAVELALKQLKTERENVKVTVLKESSRGFLGLIGGKEAEVEVVRLADPLGDAVTFLKRVTEKMDLAIDVTPEQKEDHTLLNITGANLGLLIGRRGQTLDALQYLTNVVANRKHVGHTRFILDAENYRHRRKKTLEKLADRLVDKVKRSKREVRLEPMSPLERKIIHTRVQMYDGVKTYSEGDEPHRRVVIAAEELKLGS